MKEIKQGNTVLARQITEADAKDGLNFFSEDSDFIQVGMWKNYEQNKELSAHIHNNAVRTANRTYELLYVIRGCIEAFIYDLNEKYVDTLIVQQGEILVLLECGHGYTIKEDCTTVLEVKNGPYLGADVDRHRM